MSTTRKWFGFLCLLPFLLAGHSAFAQSQSPMTTSTPPPAPHLVWVDSPFHEDDSLQVLAGTEEWLLSPGHTVLCTDSKGKPFLITAMLRESPLSPSQVMLVYPNGKESALKMKTIGTYWGNTSHNETGMELTATLLPIQAPKGFRRWVNTSGSLRLRLAEEAGDLTLDIPPADAEAMRQMAALLW